MTKDERLVNESIENLDAMFRYCFLMVGLREKNFPNEIETMFLHQFVRENYGGHSIEEVKMAFRMAVKSELDIPSDQVTCYENFSVRYISSILNAYRIWASNKFIELERYIQPPEPDVKLLEAPKKEDSHWGKIIEDEYQHFLSFGKEKVKYFPVEIYNQLSKDELIDGELWRKAMPIVRKKAIDDLVKQRVALEIRKFPSADKNKRVEFAYSINQTNIQVLNKKIEEYRNGEKDGEIELLAKQYCVLQFFMLSKKNMKQHIYQPDF